MRKIKCGNHYIGDDEPVYVIAEISANHAGDIEVAKRIIHAAKAAGANCIKTQTYTPDTLTIDSHAKSFIIKNGTWQGEKLYDLYSRACMPWEWNLILKEETEKLGMDFFSTAYDKTAVDYLEEINLDFYKIASFELVDIPLIEYIASLHKPIILSTGMASEEEINDAVNIIKKVGNEQIILLKCSSAYPAIYSDMNLMTMNYMKDTFKVQVGFSDHSLDSISAITAVARGAKVVEKHICLSRKIDTADSTFSLEPDEFKQMVDDIRKCEAAIGSISFKRSEREEKSVVFRKSIFAIQDIEIGDELSCENIGVIRPGNGLKPKYYKQLIGQKSRFAAKRGEPITKEWI